MTKIDRPRATPDTRETPRAEASQSTAGAAPLSVVALLNFDAVAVGSGASPRRVATQPPVPNESVAPDPHFVKNAAIVLGALAHGGDALSVDALARAALVLQLQNAERDQELQLDSVDRNQDTVEHTVELMEAMAQAVDALMAEVQDMNCGERHALEAQLVADLGISLREARELVDAMQHGGELGLIVALGVQMAKHMDGHEQRNFAKELAKEVRDVNNGLERPMWWQQRPHSGQQKEMADVLRVLLVGAASQSLADGAKSLAEALEPTRRPNEVPI